VEAMRRMPDNWQLVIAGEGPERAKLEQLAIDSGVEDRVYFPGFVDQPEKVMGLFDIFALSSHSEQFPISVVEAMAAGLPVVAPRVGDIGEMVSTDNGPWLTDAGDSEAITEALWQLTGQPDDRKRIGKANRDKARAHYDAMAMTDQYRALYWGLMGRNRAGQGTA